MFFLTNEQIEEIVQEYGGDVELVNDIQKELNQIGVINNEETYYEIICNVVAQVETYELINEQHAKSNGKIIEYNLIDIIEEELDKKDNGFEDSKQDVHDGVKYL